MPGREWRFLELKMPSYARAALYMPTVLTLKEKGKIPNTLAWISFEKPAACLFYYNDPVREVDLKFCREQGIEVGRRDTGGAPYWMDPGTILFVLCFDKRDVPGFPDKIPDAYRFLIATSAQAILRRFHIPAVFRPLNDLEVQGRKIAGHTLTFSGNACRWGGGPQVLKPKMELMSRALQPLPEKFVDKEAKTVEARVTSFEELLGWPPSFEEVKEAYISGLEEELRVIFRPGELTAEEKAMMAEREKRDFSEAWIMAMSEERKFGPIPPGVQRGEHVVKVPQGPLIRAVVLMRGEEIFNISLTGSIHCVPVEIVEQMETALKGADGTEERIGQVVHAFFQKPQVQIAGAKPEDFIHTIMGAIKKMEEKV
ncbi:MAG: lipoate--protein ligase family protein [Deltaproteobacteria bacterium]|nr:lipoate--protein ligase family protein [Deltaproteobacteria bacterium]